MPAAPDGGAADGARPGAVGVGLRRASVAVASSDARRRRGRQQARAAAEDGRAADRQRLPAAGRGRRRRRRDRPAAGSAAGGRVAAAVRCGAGGAAPGVGGAVARRLRGASARCGAGCGWRGGDAGAARAGCGGAAAGRLGRRRQATAWRAAGRRGPGRRVADRRRAPAGRTRARGYSAKASSSDSYRYTMSRQSRRPIVPFQGRTYRAKSHSVVASLPIARLSAAPVGPVRENGRRDRRPLLHRRARQRRPAARGRVHRRRARRTASPSAGGRLLRRPARPRHRGAAAQGRAARPPTTTGTLLDLGCGYGPIACVLADLAPAATVYAVDVNARARELTAANAARARRWPTGCGSARPDEVPDDVRVRPDLVQPADPGRQGELHDAAAALAAPARPGRRRLAGGRPAPRRRLAAALAASSRAGRSSGTPARRASGCCGSPGKSD